MKRVFSLLLAALTALCAFPIGALAAGDGRLHIRSAGELTEFSRNCVLERYSENLCVVLDADIDLTGSGFEPIPLFKGEFDGAGHAVSGLEITGGYSSAGLFRLVLPGGKITSLSVSGNIAPGSGAAMTGGIAAENRGEIAGCSFSGSVKGVSCAGGIVGLNSAEGVIESCVSRGSVEGQHRVGGVAGENAGIIRLCTNEAEVNTETVETTHGGELLESLLELRLSAEEIIDVTDIGGIAGRCSGVIRGCENRGSVGHINIGYNVGGIAGRLSCYVEDCVNTGSVCGRKDVGGVVGQIDPHTEWDISGSTLTLLREKLAVLHSAANTLADDLSASSGSLSAELTSLFSSVDRAEASLDTLSESAVEFTNANIGTLNRLSERVDETVSLIAPAAEAFSESTKSLPAVFRELSTAAAELKKASLLIGENSEAADEAISAAGRSLSNIRSRLNELLSLLNGYSADPSSVDMGELLSSLTEAASDIRSEFSSINSSLMTVLSSFTGAGEAGKPLAEAMEKLDSAFAKTSYAIEKFNSASSLIANAFDTLSRYDALSFTPINDDAKVRRELFDALSEINTECTNIAELIGEHALEDDFKRVSDALNDIISTVLSSLSGISVRGSGDMFEDVSDKARSRTDGTVGSCSSSGSVLGEVNVGGIAGAVTFDFEFDLEDEFDLSSLLSDGAKYAVYSGLIDCTSSSSVTARMTDAGGIAGRMDLGAVIDCSSTAEVTAHDEYAGGVAGRCSGSITGCMAHSSVTAQSHMGGIVGLGNDVSGCLSMCEFGGGSVFLGSIAGEAGGIVSRNYYIEGAPGGVDGFSFTGEAEPVSYSALYKRSRRSEVFGFVTVTFIGASGEVGSVRIPCGGSVDELPAVPDLDGKKWRWDDFGRENVRSNLTVRGGYFSPIPTLRTAEEPALFLAEGEFDEGDSLAASSFEPDCAALGQEPSALIGAYSVFTEPASGAEPVLVLHFRAKSGGKLFISDEGSLREADYTEDGSYIVFPISNGGSFCYFENACFPAWAAAAIAAGSAAVLICAAVLTIRAIRGKRKHAR